jgi:nucleotide-binding universal stress UspA family protein
MESLRDSGRRILAQGQEKARKQGVKATPIMIENIVRPVSDVILNTARKCRADVIVMGTHGRRGITRLVLGSDAEGVVRQANVPVLLVRASSRKRR